MATGTWTAADVEKQNAKTGTSRRMPLSQPRKPAKARSKYGAVRCEVNGRSFDSKAEAARYEWLLFLGSTGSIRNLELQPWWWLTVQPNDWRDFFPVRIGKYRADFAYEELTETGGRWDYVVEDVKGFKTPSYRWKKKHFEAQYGIQIREV
jgi:Protein of unknown function (DUF1064)